MVYVNYEVFTIDTLDIFVQLKVALTYEVFTIEKWYLYIQLFYL